MARRQTSRLPVLLLALALAACGSSPKTHFYTLAPVPAEQPRRDTTPIGPISVGNVQLPGTLDRQSLVIAESGNQVKVSDQDRWAAPLDELVRRTLTDDLRSRLPGASVLAPGDKAPTGTRTLALNMQHFMADSSGRVELDADWAFLEGDKPGRFRHATIRVTANGRDGNAVTEAMSAALGKLADRIAAAA